MEVIILERKTFYKITKGESVHYYVEMCCTGMFGNGFGNGWNGLGPSPTDMNKSFSVLQADVAIYDGLADELHRKFKVLAEIAKVSGINF
jgi:hypothetical protein